MNSEQAAPRTDPTAPHRDRVGAVLALKPLVFAKSRVDTVPAPLRRRLAWSMALDTLASLAAVVDHVVVVSDQPSLQTTLNRYGLQLQVLAESRRAGLNPALQHGAVELQRQGYRRVVACVGDLPALRPSSLRLILAASTAPRSFVADASGIGTTMVIANGGDLDPRFQGRSAAAHHSSGALSLTDELIGTPVPDARRDVDTEVDLSAACALGLGRYSSSLVDPATGLLARYTTITVALDRGDDGWIVISSSGHRMSMAGTALTESLRVLHPGQRLHAVLAGGQVLSAWL